MKYFPLLLLVLLINSVSFADGVLNLWSGKRYEFGGEGRWQIVTGHGRILAGGSGKVTFQIPQLKAGSLLDAVLKTEKKVEKLRFHSSVPLSGIKAVNAGLSIARTELLQNYGVVFAANDECDIVLSTSIKTYHPGKLQLVFTDRAAFPMIFEKTWKTICDYDVRNPGTLGISFTKKEKIIDDNGEFNYIHLEKDKYKIVIFSPDFDLKNIDNILLIKYIIRIEKTRNAGR